VAFSDRGVALVDIVAALALILVITAMAAPVVGGTLDREHTIIGAQHLAGQLQRARMEALKRSAAVAVRMELVGERAAARLYVDGNGNGVVQRDIDRGADLPLAGIEWLDAHARDVSFRVNQTVTDAGGSGSLEAGSDPLRIGRTALVTFSPLGSSSSGTLYVAAARGPQMAIRVYGASGRIRVLMFDARTRQWHP
jgi:type II secretion system GspH-like protein